MTPEQLTEIRAFLSKFAPEAWAFMGAAAPFTNEVRSCDHFGLVLTVGATDLDSEEIGAAVADMPRIIADLLSEVDRLNTELAAAKVERVPEWRTFRWDGATWHAANTEELCLLVGPDGWQMWRSVWAWLMKLNPMENGPETDDAGKAACMAAYLRAIGQ